MKVGRTAAVEVFFSSLRITIGFSQVAYNFESIAEWLESMRILAACP